MSEIPGTSYSRRLNREFPGAASFVFADRVGTGNQRVLRVTAQELSGRRVVVAGLEVVEASLGVAALTLVRGGMDSVPPGRHELVVAVVRVQRP